MVIASSRISEAVTPTMNRAAVAAALPYSLPTAVASPSIGASSQRVVSSLE